MKTSIQTLILFFTVTLLGAVDLSAQNEPQQQDQTIYWASAGADSATTYTDPVSRLRLLRSYENGYDYNYLSGMSYKQESELLGDPITVASLGVYLLYAAVVGALGYKLVNTATPGAGHNVFYKQVEDYNPFTSGPNALPSMTELWDRAYSSVLNTGLDLTTNFQQAIRIRPLTIDNLRWTDVQATSFTSAIKSMFPNAINSSSFGDVVLSSYHSFSLARRLKREYQEAIGLIPWRFYRPLNPIADDQFIEDYFGVVKIYKQNHPFVKPSKNNSPRMVVGGDLVAERIAVSSSTGRAFDNWADYVFEPGYELRPIGELEAYIKENGHLPEVLSTAEVKEQGLDLVNMDITLLKKVEELTLYIIEQNKQLEAQHQLIEDQSKKLDEQDHELSTLKAFEKRLQALERDSNQRQ